MVQSRICTKKIPKDLLDKVENPNFHIHKLKLPFRMCIVAPSGSGKTNFLVNLLAIFSEGKGTFTSIDIITRNKDEPSISSGLKERAIRSQ